MAGESSGNRPKACIRNRLLSPRTSRDYSGTPDTTSDEWNAFATRFPRHRFLESDTIYALSEPVIDAIKSEIAGFFSPEEEAFERDLARSASFAFQYCRAIGFCDSGGNGDPDVRQWRERPDLELRESKLDEYGCGSIAVSVVDGYYPVGERERDPIDLRKAPMSVGW